MVNVQHEQLAKSHSVPWSSTECHAGAAVASALLPVRRTHV
jgi:hypothetical protein